MAYGSGSVTYLKNENKYRAYFAFNGLRTSKRFDTNKEALDWLAKCRSENAMGTFTKPNEITLGSWVIEYLETYSKPKVKVSSYNLYIYYATKLESINKIPIQKITSYAIQKMLNDIKSLYLKKAVYKFMVQVFKQAKKTRIINYNVMEELDVPKYKQQSKEVFSDKEMEQIKKQLPKNKYGNFFLAAIATGCRIGELLGLKINNVMSNHIHIENQIITNTNEEGTPKTTYSVRDIYLPQSIIDMLQKEWSKPPIIKNGYVFHKNDGRHLPAQTITDNWRSILIKANVPYRNFHYIRHTHATNLLHKFDYVEVSKRLGHSSPSITLNMYGHTKNETIPEMINEIEKMTT